MATQLSVGPNKIKVLVLRQRRPSKFRPMGHFYCRTENKLLLRRIFEGKKIQIYRPI